MHHFRCSHLLFCCSYWYLQWAQSDARPYVEPVRYLYLCVCCTAPIWFTLGSQMTKQSPDDLFVCAILWPRHHDDPSLCRPLPNDSLGLFYFFFSYIHFSLILHLTFLFYLTPLSYWRLRTWPTVRKGGNCIQQVCIVQEPETPWHLQLCRIEWRTAFKKIKMQICKKGFITK